AAAAAQFVPLSSFYTTGTFGEGIDLPSSAGDSFGPVHGPGDFCPQCPQLLDVGNWVFDPGLQKLFIQSARGEVDLTAKVTPEARSAFGAQSVRWVSVAETDSWLGAQGPRLASIRLAGTGINDVLSIANGRLSASSGQGAHLLLSRPNGTDTSGVV